MSTTPRLHIRNKWTPRPSPLNPRAASFVPDPSSSGAGHPHPSTGEPHDLNQAGPATYAQNPSQHEPPSTATMLRGFQGDTRASTRISPQAHLREVESQRTYILQQLQFVGNDIDVTLEEIILRRAGWGSTEAGIMQPLEERLRNSRGLHEWLQSKYVDLNNEAADLMINLTTDREDHDHRERMM